MKAPNNIKLKEETKIRLKNIDEYFDFIYERGLFDTQIGQIAFFKICLKIRKLDYMLNKLNKLSIPFSQEAVDKAKDEFYCTCAICGQKKRPDEGAYYKERIKEFHINWLFESRLITPRIVKLFNIDRESHYYRLFECDKCRKRKEKRIKTYNTLWIALTIAALIWAINRTSLSMEDSVVTAVIALIMFTFIASLAAKFVSKIVVFLLFINRKSSIPNNIPEDSILKRRFYSHSS